MNKSLHSVSTFILSIVYILLILDNMLFGSMYTLIVFLNLLIIRNIFNKLDNIFLYSGSYLEFIFKKTLIYIYYLLWISAIIIESVSMFDTTFLPMGLILISTILLNTLSSIRWMTRS